MRRTTENVCIPENLTIYCFKACTIYDFLITGNSADSQTDKPVNQSKQKHKPQWQ